MSIRRKLLVWMVPVFVAVFGMIGFTTARAVRAQLTDRLDRSMVASAESAVAAAELLTPEQSSAFSRRPSDVSWSYLDAKGARQVRSGVDENGEIGAPDLDGFTVDDLVTRAGHPFTVDSVDGTTRLRVVAVPFGDGAVLVMARPMTSIDDTVADLTWTFVAVGGAGLILSIIAIAVAARAAVRPVEEMIDLAHAIGEGDMSHRASAANPSTEVGRLAEALNAMLERIEQAFHDKEASELRMREFLSNASHELRNPLTSIRAHAELYRNPSFSPGDSAAYASRIEAEAVRMSRLVDDLLLLARLDQGTELHVAEVDVVALAEQAVEAARVIEPARDIRLLLPDEQLVVTGDAARLRQAIDNLLANVRVHGGSRAEVAVRVARDGETVVVEVADDGPGVDASELASLADRFYRAAGARNEGRPGTGLGLSIVAAVAAGHRGRVEFESVGGFTARLTLPVLRVSERNRVSVS